MEPADPLAPGPPLDVTAAGTDPATGASARLELTTVTPHSATFHHGTSVTVVDGLEPDAAYEHDGIAFRTLPQPAGPLRSRLATVNDVHFGETEAGHLDGSDLGPIRSVPPGATPYPEVMNHAAVAEIAATEPLHAVIVKGDLTSDGTDEEFAAFEACYRPPFGDRLHVIRGNHDAYRGQDRYAGDHWVELDGVALALLDTVVPYHSHGSLSADQLEWLDTCAARSTVPVIVMGHHPQWFEGTLADPGFLLEPAASRALDALFERRPAVIAYTAGHTHRHAVQCAGGGVPSIEVGCVKDFPGTWAEYRVYDDAVLQIVHRISSPEALAWSEQCRDLYRDFGVDYTEYALGRLDDRCFVIPLRT